MKKAERYYQTMRQEAKRVYELQGNMDWTSTSYWGEDETTSTMKQVVKIAQSKTKLIKTDLKLGIYGEEKADYEEKINNKVAELANVRIDLVSA